MNKSKRKKWIILSIVCFFLVLLIFILAAFFVSSYRTGVQDHKMSVADAEAYVTATPMPDDGNVQESVSIDIPGYDAIELKAGQTEQSVTLYNPEENTCYFKMSLILPDGTTIWESDLLEPGKAFYTITLNQALAAGIYPDTSLKYDCYSLSDQRQLNGSDIKVNLIVK